MADRPAKDWHGALSDSITAAHGLSGLIAGLAGGFDRTDQTLGIPPSTATEAEAKAFIEAHNPDWKVSAHHVAFTVWQLWRDIIHVQHFNPVWATMADVVDQGKVGWYCRRVSDGCKNCYAATMNEWRGNGVDYTIPALKDVELFLDEEMLTAPLRWHRPRHVFLCSMTDLFADFVPDEWIGRIFEVMGMARQHQYQVLTKRPERMLDFITKYAGRGGPLGPWPWPQIWFGVSVEDQATADARIPLLLQTPAAVRWVSYEPALAAVNFAKVPGRPLAFAGTDRAPSLDWLVVGGESGPGARPFDLAWARATIAQCRAAGVPVFVKQLGTRPFVRLLTIPDEMPREDSSGEAKAWVIRDRKGGDIQEWPEDLRVREWPQST